MAKLADGFFPWDDIPDSGVLPNGTYQARGENIEVVTTSTGKKMLAMTAVIEEPAAYAGMRVFENFVLGTNDDPMAQDSETFKVSIGARRFKGLLKAANIPQSNSEAQIYAAFSGTMFVVQATQYVEAEGDYAGTVRNRYNFYAIGSKQIGVVAGASAAPTAPTAPTPPAPGPVSPPAAAPTTTPPAAQSAPEAQAAPAMIPCGKCGKEFPVQEFGPHVASCVGV